MGESQSGNILETLGLLGEVEESLPPPMGLVEELADALEKRDEAECAIQGRRHAEIQQLIDEFVRLMEARSVTPGRYYTNDCSTTGRSYTDAGICWVVRFYDGTYEVVTDHGQLLTCSDTRHPTGGHPILVRDREAYRMTVEWAAEMLARAARTHFDDPQNVFLRPRG